MNATDPPMPDDDDDHLPPPIVTDAPQSIYLNVGEIDYDCTFDDLRALHTFATCDAPAKPGDTTVITIRRTDHHQLATRCQVITNPKQPERALQ